MRCFTEYVSCCFATPEWSLSEEVLLAETTPKLEETTPLKEETMSSMPSHMVAPRMKNRVRVRITRPTNPEWKPSLFVIMEDNVTPDKREKTPPEATTPAVVDRVGKGMSSTKSRSKVKVRNNSNDTRPNPVSFMSFLTFAPSPSMF